MSSNPFFGTVTFIRHVENVHCNIPSTLKNVSKHFEAIYRPPPKKYKKIIARTQKKKYEKVRTQILHMLQKAFLPRCRKKEVIPYLPEKHLKD